MGKTRCSSTETIQASNPAVARERPIIFSAPMVRALLAGKKTMTRRLATSPLRNSQPGDRLWVREAWQDYCPMWEGRWCGHGTKEGIVADHRPVYRADPPESHLRGPEGKECPPAKWKPSIHMPRWASRLTLIVSAVKVERLQEITEADARAEGCLPSYPFSDRDTARKDFMHLWDELHGPGAWNATPEVVAITFEPQPGCPSLLAPASNAESFPNNNGAATPAGKGEP